jgi:hypothetical protein
MSQGPARQRLFDPTDWRLRVDPNNVGLSEGWFERGLPDDSVLAEVPGIWNTTVPGYAGVAWYEAQFRNNPRPDTAVRVVFGASNYQTDVWLNGVYLGRHEGGYDPFAFLCTDLLRDGENRLTLRIVDPPLDDKIDGLDLRTTPTGKESWYGGYGGPWGGVWLEWTGPAWIQDVRVQPDLVGQRVTFQVTLASSLSSGTAVEVRADVSDPRQPSAPERPGRIPTLAAVTASVRVAGEGARLTLTVPTPSIRAWSPESPNLYIWVVRLTVPGHPVDDAIIGELGFRTVEWRDGVFYLNGAPRYLKGALLQPTYPRTLVVPSAPPLQEVEIARRAGLNLLRCHLRPPDSGLLFWCNRAGLMTYVEPPLAWIEPSPRLLEHGKREIEAMVRMCANHPSVVMWGIFNENARATEAVGAELMAHLAALDPTRPIVENSGGAAVGEVGMWAWGGQSRCWSPGWETPRPLNDVHIYLANPLRQEARSLLATVGDGPILDVTPGRPSDDRIESRMSADAVLVSEYGCGALPDFEAALAAFGDEQHLADATLLRDIRDDLARALAARGLDREIGDVPSLVQQTQALQAEGILAQTGALRRNPNVSGIILTQLADAGWEQMAGLVGLWRHPRPALDAFKRALAPRLLHLEPDDPCGTGSVRIRSWLIEDPGLPPLAGDGDISYTVEPAQGSMNRTPTTPSEVGTHFMAPQFIAPTGGEGHILPLPTEPGWYRVRARLTAGDWSDEATCSVRRLPDLAPQSGAGLVLLGRGLHADLPAALTALPPDWRGPILAHLPSKPSQMALAQAVERARAGAHLCLLGLEPRTAEPLVSLLDLPLGVHGARGNFMGMHHYLREHPIVAGLGAPCLADASFAEVLPAWAAEELPGAEILVGCFTVPDGGRAFLWRGSVQTLPFGQGRLTIYQLVADSRQGGALGRYLLDRLVGWLRSGA